MLKKWPVSAIKRQTIFLFVVVVPINQQENVHGSQVLAIYWQRRVLAGYNVMFLQRAMRATSRRWRVWGAQPPIRSAPRSRYAEMRYGRSRFVRWPRYVAADERRIFYDME
jgi:hypothetical protein